METTQITQQQALHGLFLQVSGQDEHAVLHVGKTVVEVLVGLYGSIGRQLTRKLVGGIGKAGEEALVQHILHGRLQEGLVLAVVIVFVYIEHAVVGQRQKGLQKELELVGRGVSLDGHAVHVHLGFHAHAAGGQ